MRLAAAVPLVTAVIPSVVMGVDAAVIVEMEGDGEADDDEDDSEGSTGEIRGCGRKATAFGGDNA